MKVGGIKTHIYLRGLLSPFCLKNLINKKHFLLNFVLKLSRMIENGLTKKINPNTNIFNAVSNAVQTFKELFT
jgi:hypothetical protein